MVQSGGPFLARDTNCDNIVEVILPEISLAEGLVFVEEVYSSINSLKALYPNRDFTDQNPLLLQDNNNNNSYDLDIENDPDVQLTIRGSEDKDSRLTETEPQTISIAEDISCILLQVILLMGIKLYSLKIILSFLFTKRLFMLRLLEKYCKILKTVSPIG